MKTGVAVAMIWLVGAVATASAQTVIRYAEATPIDVFWTPQTAVGAATPELVVSGLASTVITYDVLGGSIAGGRIIFEHRQDATFDIWHELSGSLYDYTFTQFDLKMAPDGKVGWRFPVSAFYGIRARLIAPIVGSGTVLLRLRASAAPIQPFTVARQGDPTRLKVTVAP
jgi:hypothetical protein